MTWWWHVAEILGTAGGLAFLVAGTVAVILEVAKLLGGRGKGGKR